MKAEPGSAFRTFWQARDEEMITQRVVEAFRDLTYAVLPLIAKRIEYHGERARVYCIGGAVVNFRLIRADNVAQSAITDTVTLSA